MYHQSLVYADDIYIVLLAPRRQALQLMVVICSSYAGEHNLLFSTNVIPTKSKSKCLIFSHSYTIACADVSPIVLNGQTLPYVSSGKHLGNTLDSGVKNKDLQIKRGITIGKLNGVLQEFYFAHPCTKCSIMHKYCTSFYGCELWDLVCEDFSRLLTSWNIYVRKAWDLTRSTYRRLIAPLSDFKHIRILSFNILVLF